jgi:sugar-specific transcriptional regulator TrmB
VPLTGLGLSAADAAAYHLLVAADSATPEDLVPGCAADVREARTLLEGLASRGLAARSGTSPDRYVASPPSVALGAMLLARQQELRSAEQEITALTGAYRDRSGARSARDVVDVVLGATAVAQRFSQLQAGAQEEVLAFVLPAVEVVSGEENVEEDRAASRGVQYRILLERAVLDRPGSRQVMEHAMSQGEQVRVTPQLPGRLLVADRAIALVPMRPAGGAQEPSALLVHASPLLDFVVELFDAYWRQAVPLMPTGDASGVELSYLDRRVLGLLTVGLTDAAAAKHLGLSLRTVQRRVRLLMDLARVQTRFQLGLEVTRLGWLSPPRDAGHRRGGNESQPGDAPR